jgi:hypothetical protein
MIKPRLSDEREPRCGESRRSAGVCRGCLRALTCILAGKLRLGSGVKICQIFSYYAR